jgi:hypothetical protein
MLVLLLFSDTCCLYADTTACCCCSCFRQMQGSLRSAIDACLLDDRLTNRPNYATVLSLALGVARAMAHLHSEGVIHGGGAVGCFLLLSYFVVLRYITWVWHITWPLEFKRSQYTEAMLLELSQSVCVGCGW